MRDIKTPSTNVQFTPYEISMCLYDIDRTRQWKQAIEKHFWIKKYSDHEIVGICCGDSIN